jgi:hypothetical protein
MMDMHLRRKHPPRSSGPASIQKSHEGFFRTFQAERINAKHHLDLSIALILPLPATLFWIMLVILHATILA